MFGRQGSRGDSPEELEITGWFIPPFSSEGALGTWASLTLESFLFSFGSVTHPQRTACGFHLALPVTPAGPAGHGGAQALHIYLDLETGAA